MDEHPGQEGMYPRCVAYASESCALHTVAGQFTVDVNQQFTTGVVLMFSVTEFLDRAKAGAGGCSDYRLSKLVGVSTQAVSAWRVGRTVPELPAILELCKLSGDDPEHVLACIQSMRASNDDVAAFWRKVADRTSGVANVLLLAGIAMVLEATMQGWTADALALLTDPARVSLYIMLSTIGRFAYRLSRLALRQRRAASAGAVSAPESAQQ